MAAFKRILLNRDVNWNKESKVVTVWWFLTIYKVNSTPKLVGHKILMILFSDCLKLG